MCQLFETVQVKDGVAQHLPWHAQRMDQARREVWGIEVPIILQHHIAVPPEYYQGLVRCNIFYGPEILQVSFSKYEKRIIRSLKMVIYAGIDYHLKYADRSVLTSLYAQRDNADEIIIVKNGLITDTSMSNLIFFDGSNWVTPANPLLKGTCRERLLAAGWLTTQEIHPRDLINFTGCKLINAMRQPDEEELIPVSEIS